MQSKGFYYDVPSGRRDGRISLASETFTNLPPPTANLAQLTENFASKGLNQEDLVTLSGAHSIGKADCSSFSQRLYNFSATIKTDPFLNPFYAAELKRKCPQGTTGTSVPMDPPSPLVLDNSYYSLLLQGRGLFTSDQALLTSPVTAFYVTANLFDNNLFLKKFAAAMVELGYVDVLTGTAGEVRLNCSRVNKVTEEVDVSDI